jgi:transposase
MSNAAVAMSHGINPNLARRWVRDAEQRAGGVLVKPANGAVCAAFVPLQLPAVQAPAAGPADIRVELRRGPIAISVSWPCAAASECAAWMRELLR